MIKGFSYDENNPSDKLVNGLDSLNTLINDLET